MKEFWLNDLKNKFFSDENVNDWEKITGNDVIFFYKLNENKNGFLFHSCEIVGFDGEDENKKLIEPLFWGISAFDGVRHLYLGDDKYDNEGYLNYPNIDKIIWILENLLKLEKTYCYNKWE